MSFVRPWPYAAKAVVQHEWDIDHLNVWITFRFSMDTMIKPPVALWICMVDDVEKEVSDSEWIDAWTLLLTVPDIAVLPDRVTLEYEGPNANLRISWAKQWEPFGPILSISLSVPPATMTFSTGPAQQDAVNISGKKILFIDCSTNAITIGGFIGGINGQVLHVARLCAAGNPITLKHNAGTGNQDLLLHAGNDESLGGEYGGWNLVCNGINWYDTSHAKHV